ncbi:MAG TPA: hypothetical protein VE642_11560, partial [Pyrinomonadaceae bacterium]|nr:hypothetical protein [Pyrinomonadaceae bacterium]
MKAFIAAACACALLVSSSTAAAAQTRTRRGSSSAQKRRTTSAPASHLDAARTNTVRLQLANLSKDMTRFLYLYGRISKDLELTSAQTGSADAANQAKAGLIRSIGDMRDRLDQLEGHFRFE